MPDYFRHGSRSSLFGSKRTRGEGLDDDSGGRLSFGGPARLWSSEEKRRQEERNELALNGQAPGISYRTPLFGCDQSAMGGRHRHWRLCPAGGGTPDIEIRRCV